MFNSLLNQRYTIVAKSAVKIEMEQLGDKMTDKHHYVIFTKTQDLKPESIVILWDEENKLGIMGYPQKSVYNIDSEDDGNIKKAKFAHVVKAVPGKQFLSNDVIITADEAKKWFRKLIKVPDWYKGKRKTEYLEHEFDRLKRQEGSQIQLGSWLDSLLARNYHTDKERLKAWMDLGYLTLEKYDGKVRFFSPKAYKLETTFRLEWPKEEKLDTTLTAEEKEILKNYSIALGDPTSFRVPMTTEKLEKNIDKMSDDDIAWHLITSKNSMAIGEKDCVRNRFGFREICVLQLMNDKIAKKDRTQIADYILDKGGVSFVAGPTIKKFIVILAKQGKIDPKILKAGKEGELTDAIYYGRITDPDELRKVDYKKYDYQLANNPHTPKDVLEKIAEYHKKTQDKSMDKIADDPEIGWTGSNPTSGRKAGEDWNLTFKDLAKHPNYPTDKLIKLFRMYQEKYKDAPKTVKGMIPTLWQREDLPKEMINELIKYEDKYHKEYKPDYPPYAMDNEKEILDYWKKVKKEKDDEYYGSDMIRHPHCPSEILREVLERPEVNQSTKSEAYNTLKERNEISDNEIVSKVKKELKFNAPDDLLKQFGLQAWIAKGDKELKFAKVSSRELDKLKKEMTAATTHDDFTFEVVDAYTIDRQIHKDYPKMAKEIGNIKHGVYHGTSMANAAGILATGINTKGDSRTGAMFGNGFYLASSASKAAQYASDNFSKSGYGIVFKMDVALGKTAEWKYGRPEADNIMSNRNDDERKKIAEYAKKEGFEYSHDAPRWHLTHDSVSAKKGLALQHDEFVVKNGQQINITEIILVHKEEKNEF